MPLTPHAPGRALSLVAFALAACAADPAPRLAAPAVLDLGAVPLGQAATATFAVRNVGDRTVAIDAIYLMEGASDGWALRGDTSDLFAGSSSQVVVTFAPTARGPAEGLVAIRSDDPGSAGLGVRLVGQGAPPTDQDGGLPGDRGTPDPGGPADDTDPDTDLDCGDADGDGHDRCDLAGDCDDADPAAYPVVVDAAAAPGGSGTVAAPFATLAEALDNLDASCREVVLAPGTHTASVTWSEGPLTVRGAGDGAGVVVTPPAGLRAFEVAAGGAVRIADLTLSGARLAEGDGGAALVTGSAALVRVRALDNRAPDDGGAVAVSGGALRLDACTLSGNAAGDAGGALFAEDAVVVETNSVWTANAAEDGGAIATRGGTLSVDGASLSGNASTGAGGAVHVRDADELVLERAALHGNTAGWRGGGLYVSGARGGVVRNLVVQDGRAEGEGGGIALSGETSLVIANNTIVGNEGEGEGGGLWISTDATSPVHAWSNVVAHTDAESGVWASEWASASVAYTLVWANDGRDLRLPARADDGHNVESDPRFVSFTDDGAPGDDLALAADSPAVDAGPPDGAGPDGYPDWADRDGSPNDRGHTGGPGAR